VFRSLSLWERVRVRAFTDIGAANLIKKFRPPHPLSPSLSQRERE